MSEISAATGLTSLEDMDEILSVNRSNYLHYHDLLSTIPGVILNQYNRDEDCNYQYVVAEINRSEFGLSRDAIVAILRAENVYARRYFYPGCHRMEPYQSYFPNAHLVLSETEKLTDKVICFPTGTTVSRENITDIVEIIKFAHRNASELMRVL